MALTHWKPFGDLISVNNKLDRLFEDEIFDNDYTKNEPVKWYPVTDIYETKDDYVFKLQVPGLKKDEVSIEICENVLSISGERKVEKDVKKENYHRIERFTGKFQRSFSIPGEIECGKIKASMKDGVLELQVPKAEKIKARAIPIDIK